MSRTPDAVHRLMPQAGAVIGSRDLDADADGQILARDRQRRGAALGIEHLVREELDRPSPVTPRAEKAPPVAPAKLSP